MKYILLSLIVILTTAGRASAGLNNLFNTKFKKEYSYGGSGSKERSFKTETIGAVKKVKKPELHFSLAGNINLYVEKEDKIYYPLIADAHDYEFFKTAYFSENPFIQVLDKQAQDMLLANTVIEPDHELDILYRESQLLLQQFIDEQVLAFKENKLDLTFFTGNHLYSNNQIDYFYQSLTESFGKYQVPHYEVLGVNEARGLKDIKKEMGDLYYLLQTKMTNFVVLNNLNSDIIPKELPYEANQQFVWLEKILEKLETENFGQDLIVITYKEPSKELIDYIKQYDHLNLVAFIYGENYEYKEQEWENILFVSTPSLSKYPCSYLKVYRDADNLYHFKETKLELPGIQDLAESKLFK